MLLVSQMKIHFLKPTIIHCWFCLAQTLTNYPIAGSTWNLTITLFIIVARLEKSLCPKELTIVRSRLTMLNMCAGQIFFSQRPCSDVLHKCMHVCIAAIFNKQNNSNNWTETVQKLFVATNHIWGTQMQVKHTKWERWIWVIFEDVYETINSRSKRNPIEKNPKCTPE